MRLCLCLLLGASVLAGAAAPVVAEDNSDEAKVRALEKKWADSYKHRKIELLSSLLAEDFVITVEDGVHIQQARIHHPQRRPISAHRRR